MAATSLGPFAVCAPGCECAAAPPLLALQPPTALAQLLAATAPPPPRHASSASGAAAGAPASGSLGGIVPAPSDDSDWLRLGCDQEMLAACFGSGGVLATTEGAGDDGADWVCEHTHTHEPPSDGKTGGVRCEVRLRSRARAWRVWGALGAVGRYHDTTTLRT